MTVGKSSTLILADRPYKTEPFREISYQKGKIKGKAAPCPYKNALGGGFFEQPHGQVGSIEIHDAAAIR